MSDLAITPATFLERFQQLPADKKLGIVVEALKESEKEKSVALECASANESKAATLDRMIAINKWFSVKEAAAILGFKGVGQNNLYQFMRDINLLIPGQNIAYRRYIEAGYFKTDEYPYEVTPGVEKVTQVLRVSNRGIDYLRRKLSEHGNDNPVEE